MASIDVDERDSRGDWKPPDRLRPPPVFVWPAQPMALLKWLFGYPGYLWPWNLAYVALAVATWTFLTPSLETMRTFAIGWVAFIAARNLVMLFLIVGTWHFWLYIHKAQGLDYKYNGRWLAARNSTFLFGNQVLDNIFWNVASAWPIWTAYEVLMLWGYASGRLALVSWGAHPVYCVLATLPDSHLSRYPLLSYPSPAALATALSSRPQPAPQKRQRRPLVGIGDASVRASAVLLGLADLLDRAVASDPFHFSYAAPGVLARAGTRRVRAGGDQRQDRHPDARLSPLSSSQIF
jgi:hypothetical protein